MSDSRHVDDKTIAALPSSSSLFGDAYNQMTSGLKGLSNLGHGLDELNEGLIVKSLEIGNAYHQWEVNTAESALHHLGGAVSATGRAATAVTHEVASENPEASQAAASTKHNLGELYNAATEAASTSYHKTSDFVSTRPITAVTEFALGGPGLVLVDGAHRGGLHTDKPGTDKATTPQEAVKPAAEAAKAPAAKAEAAPTPAPATKTDAQHTISVNHGEGYWSVAKRVLGEGASNADILRESKELQALNKHKLLNPNDVIDLA